MVDDQVSIVETERLYLRHAIKKDVSMFHALWTDPRLMLPALKNGEKKISKEQALEKILERGDDVVIGNWFVVELIISGTSIGACYVGKASKQGVARIGISLFPAFWGHLYENEIKEALLTVLFSSYDFRIVEIMANAGSLDVFQDGAGDDKENGTPDWKKKPAVLPENRLTDSGYVYRITRDEWLGKKD